MGNGAQWLIKDDSSSYLIEFIKVAPNGQAQVRINGVQEQYFLADVDGDRYGAVLPCGLKKCLLQVGPEQADLFVDGQLQDPLPFSSEPAPGVAAVPASESSLLQKKIRSGTGSFTTLVVLSAINNILLLVNAPISFPFSIYSAMVALVFGQAFSDSYDKSLFLIAGLVVSFLIIAVFFVLRMLARRRTWPVWVALALILADTLLLIVFAILDMGENIFDSIINLAFHAWIIWSLVQLGLSRAKLQQLVRNQAAGQPVAAL
jgi:hypothetical protein